MTRLATLGGWRANCLMFVGVLAMQLAWSLTMAPFHGYDELAHVYRAAAVANGQWAAEDWRGSARSGNRVRVPSSLARAGAKACMLPARGSCQPAWHQGNSSLVVSTAARYNPAFYWVVGQPSRWLVGVHAATAMRILSGMMCALFVAHTLGSLRLWSRSWAPYVAFVGSFPPTVLFATAMTAPNGLEMVAAGSVWGSLLGLLNEDQESVQRRLVVRAIPGAVALVTVRSLGPLWLLLLLVATVIALGRARTVMVYRACQRQVILFLVTISTATAASVIWVVSMRANWPQNLGAVSTSLPVKLLLVLLLGAWGLVASVPYRSGREAVHDVLPYQVWLVYIPAIVAFCATGLRAATSSLRRSMWFVLSSSVTLPLLLTVITYPKSGNAWQGRYSVPFAIGLLFLIAVAIGGERKEEARLAALLCWLSVTASNEVAIVMVSRAQNRFGENAGVALVTWQGAALMLMGALALGVALIVTARDRFDEVRSPMHWSRVRLHGGNHGQDAACSDSRRNQ